MVLLDEDNGELITVVQVFRHGERNPLKNVGIKLYENEMISFEQLGLLNKAGKIELYNLGLYTRDRYKNILGQNYSNKYVKIYSTDSDRTIMSAQMFAAGLYPALENDLWNKDIKWQPIPVHVLDSHTMFGHPLICPNEAYRNSFIEITNNYYKNCVNEAILTYITKNTKIKLRNYDELVFFTDQCLIAQRLNAKLPNWIDAIFPNPIINYFKLYLGACIGTKFMKKVYIGPFFDQLVNHMNQMIKNASSGPKLLAFSAHETQIYSICNVLGLSEYGWPKTGGSLFFELRKINEEYFVNLYNKLEPNSEHDAIAL